jgi:predicted amidohydrolase YtcJ
MSFSHAGYKLAGALAAAGGLLLAALQIVAPQTSAAAPKPAASAASAPAADTIYFNGYVYTVDDHDSVQEALAVRNGRIAYVGSNSEAKALAGPATHIVDLHGRMLMPGLVDGHMHPQEGGIQLLKCNLNYERLTVAQFQAHIQACLDKTRAREPDQWLEVVNWFPVDRLDEWFALKVGATRENDPAAGPKYAGRLSTDVGLTVPIVIRAITANSAYELHAEKDVGSLEVGKLADLIVLDRNLLKIPARKIADVKVLLTVVGGRVVYQRENEPVDMWVAANLTPRHP